MINIIKEQLLKIIDDIDAGNSNLSEEELIEVAKTIKYFTTKDEPISKYQAYNYLGISRAKFDNLVKDGVLPKGRKQQGFKELFWTKKELNECLKYLDK